MENLFVAQWWIVLVIVTKPMYKKQFTFTLLYETNICERQWTEVNLM